MAKAKKKYSAKIIWFEIPADDTARAKTFYSKLFGWKIKPFPGMADYSHIDTGGHDETPDGGLMKRQSPEHAGITNFIHVKSASTGAAKVEKLGGKVVMPKTAVPHMGYFVICMDTEGNKFALWEPNEKAK